MVSHVLGACGEQGSDPWTHLPVVLEPQEEILAHPEELAGGAFSGSAVVKGDEVIFYLTRSQGLPVDGEQTIQQQWMMKSGDMLHFTEEKLLIGDKPAGASFDFRDPKVMEAEGKCYMVLGSALDGKASILLYESGDMEHWDYAGPLLTEEEEGIRCVECPDFMELDGRYLVIGALMHHQDSYGRYQMSRYYTGISETASLQKRTEVGLISAATVMRCRALNMAGGGSVSDGSLISTENIMRWRTAPAEV